MAFPDFSRRERVVSTIIGLAAAVAATIALYRPFQAIPFAIQDFSDFLPLLHRPSLAQQWNGFVHYYATQGRWNLLAYASLIAKWNVFGSNTSAWEWSRFVEIWLIIVGTYVVLRRFGADRSSAAAGAALFAVAGNAVTAWMRMTMGEPFALCFLLPAVFIAQGYRTTTRWRRDATLITGFIAAALLVKEMAVAFVPFILAVACCVDEPRQLAAPRNDERTRWLMASSALALLAVLIPIAYVARVAPPGSFASQYTNRSFSVVQALTDLSSAVLPAGATASGLSGHLRAAPNVIFLFVTAVGAALLWSRGPRLGLSRRKVAGWTALALALPVCVVAAYQPWSVFQDFYTFPYILGMSMLLAAAMTAVNTLSPGWPARLVTACCVAMLALSAMRAIPAVGRTIARREVDAAVASYLAGHPTSDSVVVIAHGFSGGHWPGTGPTLGRYAAALYPDARVAPFRDDTTCATPREVMTSNDRIGFAVRYADDCGPYSAATVSFQVRYRFLTLRPLAIRADSMRIDVCDRRCTLQRATSAAELHRTYRSTRASSSRLLTSGWFDLAGCERIGDVRDSNAALIHEHTDHIKLIFEFRAAMPVDPDRGRTRQVVALGATDRRDRPAEPRRAPRFDLDKGHRGASPDDEVDVPMSDAKPSRKDVPSLSTRPPRRDAFPHFTKIVPLAPHDA